MAVVRKLSATFGVIDRNSESSEIGVRNIALGMYKYVNIRYFIINRSVET